MTTHLIEIGDAHINSTVALCRPAINLDDGGTYHLNRIQQWLWRSWLEFWQEVKTWEGRKVVVFKGDLGEIDTKRRSVQLISQNKATIIKMIGQTIEPAIECADSLIFIRGTLAHEGKGAWLEETIADDYDHTVRDGDCKRASWYHMRTVIDGVRLDIAHHATMTGNPWGRSNSANNLAHKITWLYLVEMGQPAPDLALRAHNHIIAESSGFPVLVHYSPAWSAATEYAYRVGYENTLADIGGTIWTLDDKRYSQKDILFRPTEARRVWAMKI